MEGKVVDMSLRCNLVSDEYENKFKIMEALYLADNPPVGYGTIGPGMLNHNFAHDNKNIRLFIIDNSSLERFRDTNKCQHADIIIFAINLSSELSFHNATEWLEKIDKQKRDNAVVVLVGTLFENAHHRAVSQEKIQEYAQNRRIPYVEVVNNRYSSITGIFNLGIREYFVARQNRPQAVVVDDPPPANPGSCRML